jgi:hypothetical protein
MDCQTFQAKLPTWLPDLVMSPERVPTSVAAHLRDCAPCTAVVERERADVAQTMSLLDAWEAPEVSPYFGSRMEALLREEQSRPRAGLRGWWERVRTGLVVTDVRLKPVLGGGALALLLIAAGGGAYFDLTQTAAPAAKPALQSSPLLRDLQSLDENAPVFQQLSAIDAGDGTSGTL